MFISALSHSSHSTACLINLSPRRCNGLHITYFPSVVEPEFWVKAKRVVLLELRLFIGVIFNVRFKLRSAAATAVRMTACKRQHFLNTKQQYYVNYKWAKNLLLRCTLRLQVQPHNWFLRPAPVGRPSYTQDGITSS